MRRNSSQTTQQPARHTFGSKQHAELDSVSRETSLTGRARFEPQTSDRSASGRRDDAISGSGGVEGSSAGGLFAAHRASQSRAAMPQTQPQPQPQPQQESSSASRVQRDVSMSEGKPQATSLQVRCGGSGAACASCEGHDQGRSSLALSSTSHATVQSMARSCLHFGCRIADVCHHPELTEAAMHWRSYSNRVTTTPARAQAYSSEAQVNTFLANLASELSMIAEQPTAIFKSQAADPVESLGQALEVLHGTLETLSDVQARATRHVSFLSVRFLPFS